MTNASTVTIDDRTSRLEALREALVTLTDFTDGPEGSFKCGVLDRVGIVLTEGEAEYPGSQGGQTVTELSFMARRIRRPPVARVVQAGKGGD